MLLAEVEIRHSRPVAPTRRVAIGRTLLPVDPTPGWGPVLLGGLIAANLAALDEEFVPGLFNLVDDLEEGGRIAQPRLRYRFQRDTVGLDRSVHTLTGEGEHVWFELDEHALPEVNVLGAMYAAADIAALPGVAAPMVFRVMRKALQWDKPLGLDFVAHVLGDDAAFSRWRALPTDMRWALKLLGFGPNDAPDRTDIQVRFREAVWEAHPDRGGDVGDAGQRMSELTQARRLLLS
jgi:hypothetical protein